MLCDVSCDDIHMPSSLSPKSTIKEKKIKENKKEKKFIIKYLGSSILITRKILDSGNRS